MKTPHNHLRTTALIAAFVVSALSVHSQNIYTYSASAGTLPDAQGWTPMEQQVPDAVITNGLLHTYPAALDDGIQFWQQTNAPLDFATTSYVLEATLRITSANYIQNIGTGQRSGYYLEIIDGAGRQFAIGLATNGITINTDGALLAGQGVPFKDFNTTNALHTYRFVIEDGAGTLYIDDVLFASTPVGAVGVVPPDSFNHVIFGDASGKGFSEADLQQVRFSTLSPQLSIEVSEVRICWTSRTNKMYQIQYRSDLETNAWVNLRAPVSGNGTTNCITEPVTEPRRLYRITVLP